MPRWLGKLGVVGLVGLSGCAVLPPIECGVTREIYAIALVGTRPTEAAILTRVREKRICQNDDTNLQPD